METHSFDFCLGEEEPNVYEFRYDPSLTNSGNEIDALHDFLDGSEIIHQESSADDAKADEANERYSANKMYSPLDVPLEITLSEEYFAPEKPPVFETTTDAIIKDAFFVRDSGEVSFRGTSNTDIDVRVTKFVVVDSMEMEDPFMVTVTYKGGDGHPDVEKEELDFTALTVLPNSEGWVKQINDDISAAVPKIDRLLGGHKHTGKDRTQTMIQYGYTGQCPSSLGVYVSNLQHDVQTKMGSPKNLTLLRVNRGMFSENNPDLPCEIPKENLSRIDDGPHHLRLLQCLRGLGKSLAQQYRELLHPLQKEAVDDNLVRVWDCAASLANIACAEKPVRSAIDNLHCAVVSAMVGCTPFHQDDKNASSFVCNVPDFHVCLTNNPNIAFTHVFLDNKKDQATVVLVLQSRGTTTHFYGADNWHGSLVASSLVGFLKQNGVSGTYVGTSENEWEECNEKPHLVEAEQRAWTTYVNKESMFRVQNIMECYNAYGEVPMVFSRCQGGVGHERIHQRGSPIRSDWLDDEYIQIGKKGHPFPVTRHESTECDFKVVTYSEHVNTMKLHLDRYLKK